MQRSQHSDSCYTGGWHLYLRKDGQAYVRTPETKCKIAECQGKAHHIFGRLVTTCIHMGVDQVVVEELDSAAKLKSLSNRARPDGLVYLSLCPVDHPLRLTMTVPSLYPHLQPMPLALGVQLMAIDLSTHAIRQINRPKLPQFESDFHRPVVIKPGADEEEVTEFMASLGAEDGRIRGPARKWSPNQWDVRLNEALSEDQSGAMFGA